METAQHLRFGPFEIDTRAGELLKRGARIRLQRQSLQILLMLLDRPGEVVLREDIRLRLWPNNTIVEFDHSINAAIKRLRNALGESAEAPRYIETLAKRGYRFIGDVETVVPAMQPAVSNGSDSEPPAPVTPRYRILDRLGEGGMGVVYRAEDIRLSRQVALKFLPAPAAEIPSTILRRFEREARAASSLNHPHICTIYGLEDFDGQPVIAMELVHGETLSSRQIRGRIPREEALRIAVQVAGAMAEAHRKGIVHRDLKPANIMLTKSGVKVLDFGLAKMERATATDDETATISGMILGTPHYMSPEQAQGQEADARGDIFAFGVILYEMLASKRPFEGKNAAGIMAAILERDPPSLTGSVPASLDRVLRRCLAKNPEDRWQSAADLQAELEWLAESPTTEPLVAAARSRWIDWRWIAIGTLAVLSIALGGVLISQKPAQAPVSRFLIFPPDGAVFGTVPGPAVSPDGRRLLFLTTWKQKYQIWLRSLDAPEAVPLLGSDGAMLSPSTPFWSPNGKSIGFVVDGKLKRLDLDRPGGPGEPVTLCAAEQGGAWSRDGTILFSTGELLYRVPDNGGSPKQVTRLDERRREIAHRYPSFLPDGNHFLYEAISAPFSWSRKTIRVGSLDSSDSRILFDSDAQAVFARGHIFFLRDHMLMAQAFNVRSLAVSGEAFRMADRISSVWGLSPFSLTDSGPLVYAAASDTPRDELVWFDRGGNRLTTVTDALTPNFPVYHPQLSPDRGTLALATIGGKFTDIWLYDLSGSRRTRVTFEPGGPMAPVWSPDGRSIAFASMRNGHFDIYRKAIDGTSVEDLLYSDSDDKFPTSWSPDGKFLLFDRIGYKKPNSVWILPISVDRASSKPLALAESASAEERAEFSPDGRWISWDSQESGQREVYLVPFGAKGVSRDGRRQVSASGGDGARWRRDGREIFYRQGRSLVAVTVNNGPHGIQFGEERPLFRSLSILGYDVSADGQRFLLCLRTRQVTSLPLTVVQNWETVLRKF